MGRALFNWFYEHFLKQCSGRKMIIVKFVIFWIVYYFPPESLGLILASIVSDNEFQYCSKFINLFFLFIIIISNLVLMTFSVDFTKFVRMQKCSAALTTEIIFLLVMILNLTVKDLLASSLVVNIVQPSEPYSNNSLKNLIKYISRYLKTGKV